MAREERSNSKGAGSFHVQFSLPGLIVFIGSLVLATGFLAFALARPNERSSTEVNHPVLHGTPAPNAAPWGDLVTYDTQMERPEEYTALELNRLDKPKWVFSGMSLEQVRETLANSGLSNEAVDKAVSLAAADPNHQGTVVYPDEALIFSISSETRAVLYKTLARDPANHYMRFPFCFPGNSFEKIAEGRISGETLTWIRQLLYKGNNTLLLSDFEALMRRLPSQEERMRLVKTLSARSAVLARLRVDTETDIDKLLGYWTLAPGVRPTNLRPLLDSIKRLPEGGTISLLYFLPQFARERLYTYPLPSQPGDPAMDCHWSTMNFFNEVPDNRFGDPEYTVKYLTSRYYTVAKPTRYGDLIFILDEQGNAIHSAVYIADDIVFTKNGNNYMEPWMLMRLGNLMATYSVLGSPRILVYRNKDS